MWHIGTLSFLTLPPLPPCASLSSICFGPCHHGALCGFSHGGGERSLVNYRTNESQRQRVLLSAIFGPWHRPHKRLSLRWLPLSVPLISGPPQQMKRTLWGGLQSLTALLFAGLVWTAACFGLCHTVFVFEGLPRRVLCVPRKMTNVMTLPFTLFQYLMALFFLQWWSYGHPVFERHSKMNNFTKEIERLHKDSFEFIPWKTFHLKDPRLKVSFLVEKTARRIWLVGVLHFLMFIGWRIGKHPKGASACHYKFPLVTDGTTFVSISQRHIGSSENSTGCF